MADEGLSAQISEHRLGAVQAIEEWMIGVGAVRLQDLAARRSRMSDGWKVSIEINGEAIGLEVLLPLDFPWKAPKIYLSPAPAFPSLPHIESDGSLCLLPPSSQWDTHDPIGLMESLFVDASRVLAAGYSAANEDDFRSEVKSYWVAPAGLPEIRSFLRPVEGSRLVKVWKGKSFYLLADDEPSIAEWLRHRFPGPERHRRSRSALLCWLNEPPLPSEFPTDTASVINLVERAGLANELPKVIASDPHGVLVILGFPAAAGSSFLAVELLPSSAGWQDSRLTVEHRLTRGFRPGRMQGEIAKGRFLARSRVRHRQVQRVDPEWVHGRDSNADLPGLMTSTVAIVGCGSLGSLVARQLATAGVGRFILVDPEILEAANTGRHALGSASIGLSKATELARLLEGDFPHLLDTKVTFAGWQDAVRKEPKIFRDADLVISTIGSWTGESMLDSYLADLKAKAIYGWMEPYAAAAQAVLIDHQVGGRCFGCGMTRKGEPQFVVTKWPIQTLQQEPACGAMFQPYGAVNLNRAASLVAELALEALLFQVEGGAHRILSVSQQALDKFGAAWTDDWLAIAGQVPGGRELGRDWPANSDCAACQ